jgi:serine/threonine protein kinase
MSAFSSKLSLQNPSLMGLTPEQMGLTPEQRENINLIDDVITENIVMNDVPQLTGLPVPTENMFPENQYETSYILYDKHAIKYINFVKFVKITTSISIKKLKESLISELINYHAISELCPDYFCEFIGYNYDYDTHILTIVMENYGKSLFEIYGNTMERPQPWVIRNHIGQLLNILECLHKNNFVYFDLKLENIVIDEKGIIKLINPGTLIKIKDPNFPEVFIRGTNIYMALELTPTFRSGNPYKITNDYLLKATDIYSLGILLIIMIFPPNYGFKKVYNEFNKNVFFIWRHILDPPALHYILNKNFGEYFGDEIMYDDFFILLPSERLTIQELIVMFKEKTESERRKAKREEINKKEADSINTGANNISGDVIGPVKRTYGMGGNKSKKSRRKRNNKSKRRQRKSRSK